MSNKGEEDVENQDYDQFNDHHTEVSSQNWREIVLNLSKGYTDCDATGELYNDPEHKGNSSSHEVGLSSSSIFLVHTHVNGSCNGWEDG